MMKLDDVINVLYGTIDFIDGMNPDDKNKMLEALNEAVKILESYRRLVTWTT